MKNCLSVTYVTISIVSGKFYVRNCGFGGRRQTTNNVLVTFSSGRDNYGPT